MIVITKFEAHPGDWRPSPFPGADEALEQGCLCPKEQPWPKGLAFDSDCPVHELKQAKP